MHEKHLELEHSMIKNHSLLSVYILEDGEIISWSQLTPFHLQ